MTIQRALFWLMLFSLFVTYFVIVTFGSAGLWWVALAPVVISPLCLLVIRYTMEFGQPGRLFDLRTQSWAFLVGDIVALPLALWFAQKSWGSGAIERGSFFNTFAWIVICLIAGLLIQQGYHDLLETPAYIASGNADLLGSPSKLWHDIVVYGSLSGAFVYLGVPAIFKDWSGNGKFVVLGLGLWLVLGILDTTVRDLDASTLR